MGESQASKLFMVTLDQPVLFIRTDLNALDNRSFINSHDVLNGKLRHHH